MKQQRVWTDVVRMALRDAEADPSPGVWQRLERDRGTWVSCFRRQYRLWPRVGAAAAAVALCVVAAELWWPTEGSSEKIETERSIVALISDVDETTMPLLATVAEAASGDGVCEKGLGARFFAEQSRKASVVMGQSEDGKAAAEEEKTPVPTAAVAGADRSKEGATVRIAATEEVVQSRPGKGFRGRRKTSFGFFGGGTLAGGHTVSGMMTRSALELPVADENGVLALDRRMHYESCSFRHRQPLSFGLTVRREFSYGLSLESGAIYTLLCSEVTPAPGASAIDQRLHFIGVPLRMNWCFLERNRFSLYIGMGGMVEKCFAARLGGRTVREPAVQWSAAAAVGAQYRLGEVVGLYFEPDLSYYFTRTDLQTARTHSPLTFTLRLGVRFSF